jgi:stearoyl-CoA 9-desaturase NADPH oxidoreductase
LPLLSLTSIRTSPWLFPFNDVGFWTRIAKFINPHYSAAFGAQIISVRDEATHCKSFVLRVNNRWPGGSFAQLVRDYQPGQHALLRIQIDGRWLTRAFSVSGINHQARTLTLTIKRSMRKANSTNPSVSAWLLANGKRGDRMEIVGLSGQFKLSEAGDQPLLWITAGSGITPIKAMLDALRAAHTDPAKPMNVVHIHLCRSPSEFIFADSLQALHAQKLGYQLHVHYSLTGKRFEPSNISAICPDLAQRHAFVCGPNGFANACQNNLRSAGAQGISLESYGFSMASDHSSASHQLQLDSKQESAKQLFTVMANQPLLHAIEAQGIAVKFGCRIGICMTCQCTKRSGTVENLRTGVISDAPNQIIQLCTSIARSDLELAI